MDDALMLQYGADAFMFGTRSERKKNEPYLVPLLQAGEEEIPNWTSMPEAALELYARRAVEGNNPIVRARYADIVWEQRRDHKLGRLATENYLKAVETYTRRTWWRDATESLVRALHISLSLGDSKLRERVVADASGHINDLHEAGNFETSLEIFSSFANMPKRAISKETIEWALQHALAAAKHFRELGGDSLWTEREYLKAAARLAARISHDATAIRRMIAESFERNARWQSSMLVANHLYTDAIQAFKDIGDTDRVEELMLELTECNRNAESEFGVIQSEIRVDTSDVENLVASCIGRTLEQSLRNLALGFWPNVDAIRQHAEELKKETPLIFLLPKRTLSADGRVVGETVSETEIFDQQVIFNLRLGYQLNATFISRILQRLREEQGLTAESLTDFLCGSAVIGDERRAFLAHGVGRFFEADWVALFLHVPHRSRCRQRPQHRCPRRNRVGTVQ